MLRQLVDIHEPLTFFKIPVKIIKTGVFFLLLVSLPSLQATGSLSQIDSLKFVLAESNEKDKLTILANLSAEYLVSDYNTSIIYSYQLLELAEKYSDLNFQARACSMLGEAYYYQDNLENAAAYFEKLLKIQKVREDKKGIGMAYNGLGIVTSKTNPELALQFYERALKYKKEVQDTIGIGSVINNIGALYDNQFKQYDKALLYYRQSLAVDRHRNNPEGIATSLLNIGDVYRKQSMLPIAQRYLLGSLEISDKHKLDYLTELTSKSLNLLFKSKKDYKNALYYNERYMALREARFNKETRERIIQVENLHRTSEQNKQIESLNKKNSLQEKGLIIMAGSLAIILTLLFFLIRAFRKMNVINDKLTKQNTYIEQQNEAIRFQSDEIEKTYFELKKLSTIVDQTESGVIIADATGEIEYVNKGFERMIGITLAEFVKRYSSNFYNASLNPKIRELVAEAVSNRTSVSYQNYTVTQRGREIWIHTTLTPILDDMGALKQIIAIDVDITKLKEAERELSIKQKDITDSFKYAQRIQRELLPPKSLFTALFSDYFVIFKPKDIVSGDFYWMHQYEDYVYLSLGDSTGHGVPGAFMSVLGISLLNEVLSNHHKPEVLMPDEVLKHLRIKIMSSLHQLNTESLRTFDGIDLAMCLIDKKNNKLYYSGAYHNALIVPASHTKVQPIVLKGDRMPIGAFPTNELSFTLHTCDLNSGDSLYLYSDGYMQQPGGCAGKKFGQKRFLELISDIQHQTLTQQKTTLQDMMQGWISEFMATDDGLPQIDDITVIGIKM